MAKFIVFEGIDGAGLSTQTSLLASWFVNRGKDVVTTLNPSHTMIGSLIKGRLTGEWNPSKLCLRFLFAADTAQNYESVIKLALAEGKFVVCERYIYSALAYGAVDFDIDWLKEVYRDIQLPDITFYLKVPPRIAINRLGAETRALMFFERETHLQKVSDYYDQIASEYPNVYVVDGIKPAREVHAEIIRILSEKLNQFS